MSVDAKLQLKKDDFTARMTAMLSKANNAQGGFSRIYSLYQKFQTERFQTENSSEGESWASLGEKYAKYKLKRYGGGPRRKSKDHPAGSWNSYPGAGSKMLIGTGMLAGAVIGPGAPFEGTSNHRALFTDTEMRISVEQSGNNPDGSKFVYPQYVAEKRPFMTFGQQSIETMKQELMKFLIGK